MRSRNGGPSVGGLGARRQWGTASRPVSSMSATDADWGTSVGIDPDTGRGATCSFGAFVASTDPLQHGARPMARCSRSFFAQQACVATGVQHIAATAGKAAYPTTRAAANPAMRRRTSVILPCGVESFNGIGSKTLALLRAGL